MGTHHLREFIIDVAGQRRRRLGIERVEAHCREREHLKIDPGLIHLGNPASAKVEEFGLQFGKLQGSSFVIPLGGSQERIGDEMFLKCDGAHTG
jgi:hypothetical protein